jgi:hypothetical protein
MHLCNFVHIYQNILIAHVNLRDSYVPLVPSGHQGSHIHCHCQKSTEMSHISSPVISLAGEFTQVLAADPAGNFGARTWGKSVEAEFPFGTGLRKSVHMIDG